MSDIRSLAPSSLLVDAENPRLSEANEGQREAMRALAKRMPRKIVALAKDIVEHGLNPADLLIVTSARDSENRYVALEGNRRLVALKALENPDSFVGVIDGGALIALRALARKYQSSPIDSIQCLVVDERQDADHWITLRHTGENDGAGIVTWGSDEKSRFAARATRKKKNVSTQALDFLENQDMLTAEERRSVPVTSLERLLKTPQVREKVGLKLDDGILVVCGSDKKVAKAIKYVVDDLASDGGTSVKDIYSSKQRQDYAAKIPPSVVVKPKNNGGHQIEASIAKPFPRAKVAAKAATAQPRDILIPRNSVLAVTHDRIRAIEKELRSLSLKTYTNAVSVLFRVFVELSADQYLETNSLTLGPDSRLIAKLQVVLNDLLSKKKLTSQQAKPVKKVMAKDSYLAPSMSLMNDYIHNQHVFPAAGDLRAHWDSLQPFLMAIWSV